MKTYIILALISLTIASVTNSNQCTCDELTVQTDCTSGGCAWVTVNGSSSCSAATASTDCSTYTTESACDNTSTSTCAWKGTACSTFSGTCSDYTTTTVGGCSKKSGKCTEGTLTSGTYACKSNTVTCSAQTTADTCNYNYQDDGKMCYYSGSACAAYDMTKCSTRTLQDLCTGRCVWASNACSAQTCASITDTARCTSVMSDDDTTVTVCAASGTTCADAADTKALTSTTCLQNTQGYFYWDGSACSACSGSSNSYLLAFIGAVVLLFI